MAPVRAASHTARKTHPATRKPTGHPANAPQTSTHLVSGSDSGGVHLSGEVQQHPEQGRELEQLLAGLTEQKRLSDKEKTAQREPDSDPTKEKDELMEQLERIRRHRQQIN